MENGLQMTSRALRISVKQSVSILGAGMTGRVKMQFTRHERERLEKAMIRCKMPNLPTPRAWNNYPEVMPRTVCSCGEFYKDHPDEWRLLDKFHRPHLKILCNGVPVRLSK